MNEVRGKLVEWHWPGRLAVLGKETSPNPVSLSTNSTRSSLGLITHLTGDGPATDGPKHDTVTAFFLPFV